jgi:putative ABC transport system permease protein
MFSHFLFVAFRHALRNRTFSIINIAGLVLGMTCCLFIYLWVRDERAVDNFHDRGENLYNIYQTVEVNGQVGGSYTSPITHNKDIASMMLADIKLAVPEITHVNFYATGYEKPWGRPETFRVGDKMYKLEGSRATPDFFVMFNYPLIAGNVKTALRDASSIALSRHMAQLFFNSPQEAIGKSIRYENRIDFTVTAVFEDVTPQSSLKFDFLINWESHLTRLEWATAIVLTTLELDPRADIHAVEKKLNTFLAARLDKTKPEKVSLGLQPFRDMYLYSAFEAGKPAGGRVAYVRIFSGVAVFILIIACINFMNLSTARSARRAKEIGVRKVIGSSRGYLMLQFFGESILLAFFALLFSLVMTQLLLPYFNIFTGKHITSPLLNPICWIFFTGLMLVTGIIAGSYPALFLSSLQPVRVLRGLLAFSGGASGLRKGLVCFQFILSIGLLIATMVITGQTHYAQNRNLGYDRENIVYIRTEGDINAKYAQLKARALQMPGIEMVDKCGEIPQAMNFVVDVPNDGLQETTDGEDAISWEGKTTSVPFTPMSVGYDFPKLMRLKIVEGRDFSRDVATDSADAFLVNEEAVKAMGMKDPIGQWIKAWKKKGHIIGVIKDYNTNSLHQPIHPLIIDVKEYEYWGIILFRIEPGKTKEALNSIATVCKEINPNFPVAFQFMDDEYNKLYQSEQVVSRLTNVFAALGISISCLGLLGLVIFSAEQKTKEIGIRKVLGATVANIVNLLSKDFLKLVLISFIIAAPIAGLLMKYWLAGFAYRIPLSWWIFALAGGLVLLVAFITVAVQAIHAAMSNPVRSLRSE